jgi:hypothetical protein
MSDFNLAHTLVTMPFLLLIKRAMPQPGSTPSAVLE